MISDFTAILPDKRGQQIKQRLRFEHRPVSPVLIMLGGTRNFCPKNNRTPKTTGS